MMALIKCRECGREISDQAPACPGCGVPTVTDKVVTTQQTGKGWKGLQAVGVMMIIVGMVGCMMDSSPTPTLGQAWGSLAPVC